MSFSLAKCLSCYRLSILHIFLSDFGNLKYWVIYLILEASFIRIGSLSMCDRLLRWYYICILWFNYWYAQRHRIYQFRRDSKINTYTNTYRNQPRPSLMEYPLYDKWCLQNHQSLLWFSFIIAWSNSNSGIFIFRLYIKLYNLRIKLGLSPSHM